MKARYSAFGRKVRFNLGNIAMNSAANNIFFIILMLGAFVLEYLFNNGPILIKFVYNRLGKDINDSAEPEELFCSGRSYFHPHVILTGKS